MPLNRRDLQALAHIRLADAQLLHAHKRYDAAYYLAGYAIECALNACIAKKTKRHDFPDKSDASDSHTHNLQNLLRLSGVGEKLNDFRDDPVLERRWAIVKQWNEASRYHKQGKGKAGAIIDAVAGVRGLLECIKEHW